MKKQQGIGKSNVLENLLQFCTVKLFPGCKRLFSPSTFLKTFTLFNNLLADLGEKQFTVEQVGQLNQPLLHSLPSTLRNI